jgi:hypothetical protein
VPDKGQIEVERNDAKWMVDELEQEVALLLKIKDARMRGGDLPDLSCICDICVATRAHNDWLRQQAKDIAGAPIPLVFASFKRWQGGDSP